MGHAPFIVRALKHSFDLAVPKKPCWGYTAGWAGLGVSSRELWEQDRAGVGYCMWSRGLSMKWDSRFGLEIVKEAKITSAEMGPSILGEVSKVGEWVEMDIYKLLLPFRSLPLHLWAPSPSLLSIAPCLEQVSFKMKFLNYTRISLNNGILELRITVLNVFQKTLKSVLERKVSMIKSV